MFKIIVTEDHIENGDKNSSDECPIALSLSDMGCKDVEVSTETVTFIYNTKDYLFDLPWKAKKFINSFDGGDYVKPLQFTLPVKKYDAKRSR